jgi:DNA-binding response OmpR family regulator
MKPKITIIEDDRNLVEFIGDYLQTSGDYDVNAYFSGVDGINAVKNLRPDLVLLDLQLGDLHGEAVCKEIRKMHNDVPIIILTVENANNTVISCLNAGADDYITKPFHIDVLQARINARLRNTLHAATRGVLEIRNLKLNTEKMEVSLNDAPLELTAKEYELLKYLMLHKDHILTRDKILNAVWGYNNLVETRVVDVHIGKLRKKIEDSDESPMIQTIRGFGYRING